MGGGVSPFEWIMPPVAISHAAYNAAAQQVSPRAKIEAPGSPDDRRHEAQQTQREVDTANQAAEDKSAAEYLAANPAPQTPEEELASRRRAQAAGAGKLGGKRPSQYLAGGEMVLGNTV